MDTKQIKELLELMEAHGLGELEMQDGDSVIRLCKAGCAMPSVVHPAALPMAAAPAPAVASAASAAVPAGCEPIKSPIVGTFYAAPAPDADNFVSVGARVNDDTVVCIIEAMKVMNEIKAEINGTIEKVLVQNGEPVEYGQPLFLVRQG